MNSGLLSLLRSYFQRNKLLVHINDNGPLGFSYYVKPVFLPFPILPFFGFESKLIRISLLSFAFVLIDPFATAPRFWAKLISLCNQSQQKLFHVQSEESNRFYAEAEIVVPENVTHRSTHYRRNLSRSSRTYALGCRSGYAQTSDFRSGGITV